MYACSRPECFLHGFSFLKGERVFVSGTSLGMRKIEKALAS